jgi:hypothetical protein
MLPKTIAFTGEVCILGPVFLSSQLEHYLSRALNVLESSPLEMKGELMASILQLYPEVFDRHSIDSHTSRVVYQALR